MTPNILYMTMKELNNTPPYCMSVDHQVRSGSENRHEEEGESTWVWSKEGIQGHNWTFDELLHHSFLKSSTFNVHKVSHKKDLNINMTKYYY